MAATLLLDVHIRNIPNVGLDMYTMFSLSNCSGVPALFTALFLLDYFGRRMFLCTSFICAGMVFVILMFVPWDLTITILVLCMIGRYCLTLCFNVGLQYQSELLPTQVRGQGTGVIHIIGHVATFFSSFIMYLFTYSREYAYLTLTCISLLGGAISLALPETANKKLPETVEDGENFGVDQVCRVHCCGLKWEPKPQASDTAEYTCVAVKEIPGADISYKNTPCDVLVMQADASLPTYSQAVSLMCVKNYYENNNILPLDMV